MECASKILTFPEIKRCHKCNNIVDNDDVFCSHCGAKLIIPKKYTPQKKYTKQPLKTIEEITQVYEVLAKPVKDTPGRKKTASRNAMMFLVGINTGLRNSDIISLTAKPFLTGKNEIYVIEKKTGKGRVIQVAENIMQVVRKYIKDNGIAEDELLFSSQGGGKLNRKELNRIIQTAIQKLGWDITKYGSHTLRKTYAYQFYTAANKRSKESGYRALSILCKTLNHSSEAITLAYIGIDQEEICEICNITSEQYNDIIEKIMKEEDND